MEEMYSNPVFSPRQESFIQASKLCLGAGPAAILVAFSFCFPLARTFGFHVRAAYFSSQYDRL
jgi:hypothetical protein